MAANQVVIPGPSSPTSLASQLTAPGLQVLASPCTPVELVCHLKGYSLRHCIYFLGSFTFEVENLDFFFLMV